MIHILTPRPAPLFSRSRVPLYLPAQSPVDGKWRVVRAFLLLLAIFIPWNSFTSVAPWFFCIFFPPLPFLPLPFRLRPLRLYFRLVFFPKTPPQLLTFTSPFPCPIRSHGTFLPPFRPPCIDVHIFGSSRRIFCSSCRFASSTFPSRLPGRFPHRSSSTLPSSALLNYFRYPVSLAPTDPRSHR